MDDIRPVVGDDDRRSMTYAEIATARGISAKWAERLVRCRRADTERERADRERERADQAERRVAELIKETAAIAARRRWWIAGVVWGATPSHRRAAFSDSTLCGIIRRQATEPTY